MSHRMNDEDRRKGPTRSRTDSPSRDATPSGYRLNTSSTLPNPRPPNRPPPIRTGTGGSSSSRGAAADYFAMTEIPPLQEPKPQYVNTGPSNTNTEYYQTQEVSTYQSSPTNSQFPFAPQRPPSFPGGSHYQYGAPQHQPPLPQQHLQYQQPQPPYLQQVPQQPLYSPPPAPFGYYQTQTSSWTAQHPQQPLPGPTPPLAQSKPKLRKTLGRLFRGLIEQEKREVAEYEIYSEVDGACKHCFAPGTQPGERPHGWHQTHQHEAHMQSESEAEIRRQARIKMGRTQGGSSSRPVAGPSKASSSKPTPSGRIQKPYRQGNGHRRTSSTSSATSTSTLSDEGSERAKYWKRRDEEKRNREKQKRQASSTIGGTLAFATKSMAKTAMEKNKKFWTDTSDFPPYAYSSSPEQGFYGSGSSSGFGNGSSSPKKGKGKEKARVKEAVPTSSEASLQTSSSTVAATKNVSKEHDHLFYNPGYSSSQQEFNPSYYDPKNPAATAKPPTLPVGSNFLNNFFAAPKPKTQGYFQHDKGKEPELRPLQRTASMTSNEGDYHGYTSSAGSVIQGNEGDANGKGFWSLPRKGSRQFDVSKDTKSHSERYNDQIRRRRSNRSVSSVNSDAASYISASEQEENSNKKGKGWFMRRNASSDSLDSNPLEYNDVDYESSISGVGPRGKGGRTPSRRNSNNSLRSQHSNASMKSIRRQNSGSRDQSKTISSGWGAWGASKTWGFGGGNKKAATRKVSGEFDKEKRARAEKSLESLKRQASTDKMKSSSSNSSKDHMRKPSVTFLEEPAGPSKGTGKLPTETAGILKKPLARSNTTGTSIGTSHSINADTTSTLLITSTAPSLIVDTTSLTFV